MLNSNNFSSESAINIINECLIFTLPQELNREVLGVIKRDILNKINEQNLIGVIIDFCSINVIDSFEFEKIVELIKVIELLGLRGIIVGLQPGIVSTLIYLNINTDSLTTCFNLEEGLSFLTKV